MGPKLTGIFCGLGLSGLWMLSACSQGGGTTCGTQTCSAQERCVAGACRLACEASADCAPGFVCEGRVCTASGGSSSGSHGASSSGLSTSSSAGGSGASGTTSSGGGSGGVTSGSGNASSRAGSSSSGGGATSSGGSGSGGQPDGGSCDCTAQAHACFTGSCLGDGGCAFTYRCGAGDVCATNPVSCVPFGDAGVRLISEQKVFLKLLQPADYATMRSACQSYPGFALANIKTTQDVEAVRTLVTSNALWVGVSDLGTEGTWLWADNSPLLQGQVIGWCSGEPTQSVPNEDCGQAAEVSNVACLRDEVCTLQAQGICAQE